MVNCDPLTPPLAARKPLHQDYEAAIIMAMIGNMAMIALAHRLANAP